jgi:hypothetical protein
VSPSERLFWLAVLIVGTLAAYLWERADAARVRVRGVWDTLRAGNWFRLRNLPHRLRGWREELRLRFGVRGHNCELALTVIRADGRIEPLGVVSRRVITNAGVAFMVDAFQNLVELEAMNFHEVGTGSTAEAVGDTALVTPVESRATGTQSEPASNQYRTTGTIQATAQRLLREHGVFSASSGGTLLDRSVHALITLENGDSVQAQYTLTLTAGG